MGDMLSFSPLDPNGVGVPFISPRWVPIENQENMTFELRNEEESMKLNNLYVESLLHNGKRYWQRSLAFIMLFAVFLSLFTFSSPITQGAQTAVSTPTYSAATAKHTVTWDRYSLKLDGKRLMVWSGEFHYWRLPSPALWRDVLEKIKADGRSRGK